MVKIFYMHRRKKGFPIFIVCIISSLLIFMFSQQGWLDEITGVIQSAINPLQKASYSLIHSDEKSEMAKLRNENRDLQVKLVKKNALEKDNRALRDQFAITNPPSKKLVPAYIVGIPSFFPGISIADNIIIDRGSSSKIKIGDSVIYKDNLVGKVAKVSPNMSVVYLLNHKNISFTAQTSLTSAVGIINGIGQKNITYNNVLLSDLLEIGDIVVTKDPPLLVIGKIISVNKKTSGLFQSAEVESLIDAAKLTMVFVFINE